MKRSLLLAGIFTLILAFVVSDAFAGYNFANSVSYTRTQSRNATTQTVDAVYYNPAGLVKLGDGFYVDLGNQMGMKKYSHTYRPYNKEYADKTFVATIPNLALVYKKEKAAAFLALDVPAGGGELNYENKITGLPALASLIPTAYASSNGMISKLFVKNFWIRGTLGGSFALTDMVSLTGGVKYAKKLEWKKVWGSHNNMGSGAQVMIPGAQYEIQNTYTSLAGFGGFFGGMVGNDTVKVTALYQTEIVARGNVLNQYANVPKKFNRTATEDSLPAYAALGLALKASDAVEIQLSFDYVFSGEQKLGSEYGNGYSTFLAYPYPYYTSSSTGTTSLGNFYHKKMKDQMRLGLGFEFNLGKVKPSIGVQYVTPDSKSSAWLSTMVVKPELYELCVGLGAKIEVTETMGVELAFAKHFYKQTKFAFGTMFLNKDVTNFGLGLSMKF